MKTLIISGSPRKNGDSMTLVNEIIKHLEGKVKIIHTYEIPAKEDIEALDKTREIALKLN